VRSQDTCLSAHYLVLNFYQINRDGEIRTRDRLIIKVMIPCQKINSTQKLKLLGEVPRYDLYYSLTINNLSHEFGRLTRVDPKYHRLDILRKKFILNSFYFKSS